MVDGQLWLPDGQPATEAPQGSHACFRMDLPETDNDYRHWICLSEKPLPLAPEHWLNLRDLMGSSTPDVWYWAGRALQIEHWWRRHRFCSACGSTLPEPAPERLTHGEMVRVCSSCQIHYYPVQTPCIIVLVTRGDYCLLALHQRSRTGTYTTLAGFVEAGERIEQTVVREVDEEVGVKIKNLRYADSQSWPFPSQLMLGFYAEYEAGSIEPQLEEITEAHWYHYRQLPKIPPRGTIARQLIDGFISEREAASHKSGERE
ncbi:NAD(+) diphosphatase [Gilvimarinus agarilyticus]|uniref:NAD(+) diphosphatase n=1 Tax=Gilvimarinus agarilyticus TaxID=679259 RepID=UPI001E517A02|nr:NAD(+) diphosphatase [Gilvimarinus agarilyticus]